MILVPVVVLLVLAYAIFNQNIPQVALDQMTKWLPDDGAPGKTVVVIACGVGAILSFTPFDKIAKYLSTAVHELGHALMASLFGGRPKNIHISVSGAGLATYMAPASWGRMRSSLVYFAGYIAPAIAALAGIRAVQAEYSRAWFVFATAILGLAILFLIRNLWGFIWTALVVIVAGTAAKLGSPEILGTIAAGVVGYLLIEAIQNAYIQLRVLKHRRGSGCDAEQIAQQWGINARFVGHVQFLCVFIISGLTLVAAIRPLTN